MAILNRKDGVSITPGDYRAMSAREYTVGPQTRKAFESGIIKVDDLVCRLYEQGGQPRISVYSLQEVNNKGELLVAEPQNIYTTSTFRVDALVKIGPVDMNEFVVR